MLYRRFVFVCVLYCWFSRVWCVVEMGEIMLKRLKLYLGGDVEMEEWVFVNFFLDYEVVVLVVFGVGVIEEVGCVCFLFVVDEFGFFFYNDGKVSRLGFRLCYGGSVGGGSVYLFVVVFVGLFCGVMMLLCVCCVGFRFCGGC